MGRAANSQETGGGIRLMDLGTRKIMDRAFSGLGVFSILLVSAALLVILAPIVAHGITAFVFKGTIEFRQMQLDKFDRGNRAQVEAELAEARKARQPVYDMLNNFENEDLKNMSGRQRRETSDLFEELKDEIRVVLGPFPDEPKPVLERRQYGQTRWDRTLVKKKYVMQIEGYDYSDPTKLGVKTWTPRVNDFKGTSLEPLFAYFDSNLEAMMRPKTTFYWQFLTDVSRATHFFGGIWAEMLGTFYLTFGAMIFAIPMGVIAAIYLVEYAGESRTISLLRSCISTLAGVPSIVFGLFGLAFFINTIHVSRTPSVLAGALTLSVLVLPIIIRASEEALLSVPRTYKEAALSLGAGRWRTVVTVILPAALPGILTGIVISMGRAAGETAPIIFTAAASVGRPLSLFQTFTERTPALSWNIYNLCTEHAEVDEIRHVQYGMVLTLVLLVLLLNVSAIILRARIAKKLRG